MTTAETSPQAILGELAPLYEEFSAIVSEVPETEIRIPYDSKVVEDRMRDGYKNLPSHPTVEQIQAVHETAAYSVSTERKHALIQNGFVGSVIGLFEDFQ